jgi:hypothetical protein
VATTDYAALAKPSTGLEKVRTGKEALPNPLNGFVARTKNEGPLMIPVSNADQAKEVTNFLRRDAKRSDLGLSLQYKDGKNKVVTVDKARQVHFVWKVKSELAYTADDVRKFHGHPKGTKLTDIDRIEYRIARDLDSKKDRDKYAELGGDADSYRASLTEVADASSDTVE